MITVLVDGELLAQVEIELAGHAYRHLFRARRLARGARLRLADGEGRARWAEVVEIGTRTARLVLGEPAPTHEPEVRLELLVAAPKPSRLSWLVEKATEVGVAAVRLIASERGPRSVGPGTLGRLGRIAATALEQSHRSCLPAISGVHAWDEVRTLLDPLPIRFYAQAGAQVAGPWAGIGPVALLIGPEGGWVDHEVSEIERLGCRPLGLGPGILRIETAAVVGAGVLLHGSQAHRQTVAEPAT